jgi:peptide/nickel transport system substrate-binding protein
VRRSRSFGLWVLLMLFATACSGPAAPTGSAPSAAIAPEQASQPSKTLVVIVRAEPPSLNAKPFRSLGLTADLAGRMFNAGLTIRNDAGVPTPYLAEALPQLNTDTWRVLPDGTMETTYRLRPGITWHDGQALNADDFVFSFQVYSNSLFGLAATPPIVYMEGVTAPDARTVVIKWKQTYPDADALSASTGGTTDESFPALPRHLLGQIYQAQDAEAFMANSLWTTQYVGLGPYKLDKWETGAYLEGVAFDGHILGKAKIPRIREIIMADPNTVVANLLAGEAALTAGDSIRFNDGEILRTQWADRGRIINFPNLYRIVQFQRKPEYASTRAFTDLRVRQALHHGVDFPTLNEVLQGGRTTAALGPIPPTASYYAQLEPVVAKYPYDTRRAEQLMTEAGFTRGSDGVWVHPDPQFGRMSFETNVLGSPDSDNEMHLMADSWRKLGFDIKEVSWSPAQGRDTEFRNVFPGLSTTSTPPLETAFSEYKSDRIPTPLNRWRGTNRGAWPGNAQYDRLVETWETSLNRNDRTQAIIQMNKIMNDEVVVINLYWKLNAVAAAHGLTGPRLTDPNGTPEWNIHEWEYR